MKIIFMGTPDFALSTLSALINSKHEVLAVVTQPDKAVGRSGKLKFPPVKELALKHNIKVLQFERIKRESAIKQLIGLDADLMVTCAYGQILSQKVLDITPFGVLNVHGSLLPEYRGAAPIQWAVINGEKKTGITIMKTDIGMDTGDMLLKKEIEIKKHETAGELFNRLSVLGGEALLEALDLIKQGKARLTPQNNRYASHYPMLKKENGLINWNDKAEDIVNFIHGLNPWPSAFTFLNDRLLKVHRATSCTGCNEDIKTQIENAKPGEILIADSKIGLLVKAGVGAVKLSEVQLSGSKKMSDKDFLNGNKLIKGSFFGE